MVASKSMLSDKWFVRVDGELEHLRQKMTRFAECIDVLSILAVHHTGKSKENPHFHFVCEMRNEIQKQSFAIRLKNHFEVMNRGYALDTWDGKRNEYGAVSYLYHEEDAPTVVSKKWEPEEIALARRIAKDANVIISKAKEKAPTKFVDRALKHFETYSPTQFDILKYMIRQVRANEMYWPGEFRAKSLIEEVKIKTHENENEITNLIYRNMFRN